MQTRDQKYAFSAFERVSIISKKEKQFYETYGAMAHKLPILIRKAGLAQALSFVEAKAKDKAAYSSLLTDLKATVGRNENLAALARSVQLTDYILLTKQIMDALLWYKRFAQSVLGIDATTATMADPEGGKES